MAELRIGELRVGVEMGWGGDGLGKLGLTGPGVVGLRVGWTSTGRIRGEC